MSINYTVTVDSLSIDRRTLNFESAARNIANTFFANGSNSLFFCTTSTANLNLYRFDPSTVSALPDFAARYNLSAAIKWIKFYNSTPTPLCFVYEAAGSQVSLIRRNFFTDSGSFSGAASRTATFSATNNADARNFDFHYNGATSYLFVPGSTSALNMYTFNADTVTGLTSIPSTTYPISTARFVLFYPNGANSCLFVAQSNSILMFRFDPTNPAVYTQVTFSTSSQQSTYLSFIPNGSNSTLYACCNTNRIEIYRFNPETVTGTVNSVATITDNANTCITHLVAPIGSDVGIYYGGTNGIMKLYKVDPVTVSGAITIGSSVNTLTGGTQETTPNCWTLDNNLGYMFVSFSATNDRGTSFFRNGLTLRDLELSIFNSYILSPENPIRKLKGGVITIYSVLDYFTASLYLRAGANIFTPDYGDYAYQYQVTPTFDTQLELNESFTFDGSAAITGDYRITFGTGTLTLGSRTTYDEKITMQSGTVLLINQNTELTEDFILQSGVTVNRSGIGSFTLTIPYANPGLTLGTGVTVASPEVSLNFSGLIAGSEVRVFNTNATSDNLDDTEIGGIESSGTTFSVPYSGTPTVRYIIMKVGYRVIENTLALSGSDITIPISQQVDRVHFNP